MSTMCISSFFDKSDNISLRSNTLRIKPNGTKLWRFNYQRPITKKRANLSLGKYPALSLAKARAKAVTARELLADDIDPKEHRDNELKVKQGLLEHSFEMVATKWILFSSEPFRALWYLVVFI